MNILVFEIESNEEIWELIDKNLNNIFIHKFNPNETIEWWKTNLKTKNGLELKNIQLNIK